MNEARREELEARLLEAAADGADGATLRALCEGDAELLAFAADLAAVAPALRAAPAPEPDHHLLARTRRATAEALAARRRRRARVAVPVAAAIGLPVGLGWNALVAWLAWSALHAILPAAVAPAVALLVVAAFGVLTLTAGALVIGGLPILAARVSAPVAPPALEEPA